MNTTSLSAEYELIDASCGERLERWGEILLIRPDPQVLWKTPRRHPGWKHAHGRYLRSSSGGGKWEFYRPVPENWTIRFGELSFLIRPTGFKHTGLFPEQASNWERLIAMIGQEKLRKPVRVLNLFAYTGAATCACLHAGAFVCHVDASRGIVSWAKENAALNHLENLPQRYIVDDCKKFMEREIRRGNHYDGIIMDPPSYGRGPGGEIFKLEDEIYALIQTAASVLSEDPLFFLVNSYTAGIAPSVMEYILSALVEPRFGGQAVPTKWELRFRSLVNHCPAAAVLFGKEVEYSMEAMITAENISYSYREEDDEREAKIVLDDVDFTVYRGEMVAVLGSNGSGKSTLAKHLNAILIPEKGDVVVEGYNTKNEEDLFEIRRRAGMVFQNPDNQIVATVVEEDVAFACENLGVPREEMIRRVDAALEAVSMTKYRDYQPHKLSGGQKQRVAIAGILAMSPDCLVLDEPTAMLDPKGRRGVLETISRLRRDRGMTVVLITHFMEEAAAADRIVILDQGKVVANGTPFDVFTKQSDVVLRCGLAIPEPLELLHELRRIGIDIREDAINEEKCAQLIASYLEEKHCLSSKQKI